MSTDQMDHTDTHTSTGTKPVEVVGVSASAEETPVQRWAYGTRTDKGRTPVSVDGNPVGHVYKLGRGAEPWIALGDDPKYGETGGTWHKTKKAAAERLVGLVDVRAMSEKETQRRIDRLTMKPTSWRWASWDQIEQHQLNPVMLVSSAKHISYARGADDLYPDSFTDPVIVQRITRNDNETVVVVYRRAGQTAAQPQLMSAHHAKLGALVIDEDEPPTTRASAPTTPRTPNGPAEQQAEAETAEKELAAAVASLFAACMRADDEATATAMAARNAAAHRLHHAMKAPAAQPTIVFEKLAPGQWNIERGGVRYTSHLLPPAVCERPKSYCCAILDEDGRLIGRTAGIASNELMHWVAENPGKVRPKDFFHFPEGMPPLSDAEREFIATGKIPADLRPKNAHARKVTPAAPAADVVSDPGGEAVWGDEGGAQGVTPPTVQPAAAVVVHKTRTVSGSSEAATGWGSETKYAYGYTGYCTCGMTMWDVNQNSVRLYLKSHRADPEKYKGAQPVEVPAAPLVLEAAVESAGAEPVEEVAPAVEAPALYPSDPKKVESPWNYAIDKRRKPLAVGDLVMQGYYEVTTAYRIERIFEQGSMMVDTVRLAEDGTERRMLEQCHRVVKVTQEQVDALTPRIKMDGNGHHGWIVPSNPILKPGKIRATCACMTGMEISQEGHSRKIAWFTSVEDAKAAWEQHAAAEPFNEAKAEQEREAAEAAAEAKELADEAELAAVAKEVAAEVDAERAAEKAATGWKVPERTPVSWAEMFYDMRGRWTPATERKQVQNVIVTGVNDGGRCDLCGRGFGFLVEVEVDGTPYQADRWCLGRYTDAREQTGGVDVEKVGCEYAGTTWSEIVDGGKAWRVAQRQYDQNVRNAYALWWIDNAPAVPLDNKLPEGWKTNQLGEADKYAIRVTTNYGHEHAYKVDTRIGETLRTSTHGGHIWRRTATWAEMFEVINADSVERARDEVERRPGLCHLDKPCGHAWPCGRDLEEWKARQPKSKAELRREQQAEARAEKDAAKAETALTEVRRLVEAVVTAAEEARCAYKDAESAGTLEAYEDAERLTSAAHERAEKAGRQAEKAARRAEQNGADPQECGDLETRAGEYAGYAEDYWASACALGRCRRCSSRTCEDFSECSKSRKDDGEPAHVVDETGTAAVSIREAVAIEEQQDDTTRASVVPDIDTEAITRGMKLIDRAIKAVNSRKWTDNKPGSNWTIEESRDGYQGAPVYFGAKGKARLSYSDDGSAYHVMVFHQGKTIWENTYKGLDPALTNGSKIADQGAPAATPDPSKGGAQRQALAPEPERVVEEQQDDDSVPVFVFIASRGGSPARMRVLWRMTRKDAMTLCSDSRTSGPRSMLCWTADPGERTVDWAFVSDSGKHKTVLAELGITPLPREETTAKAAAETKTAPAEQPNADVDTLTDGERASALRASNPGRQAAALRAFDEGAVTWSRTGGVKFKAGALVGARMFEWATSARFAELREHGKRFRYELTGRGRQWLEILDTMAAGHPDEAEPTVPATEPTQIADDTAPVTFKWPKGVSSSYHRIVTASWHEMKFNVYRQTDGELQVTRDREGKDNSRLILRDPQGTAIQSQKAAERVMAAHIAARQALEADTEQKITGKVSVAGSSVAALRRKDDTFATGKPVVRSLKPRKAPETDKTPQQILDTYNKRAEKAKPGTLASYELVTYEEIPEQVVPAYVPVPVPAGGITAGVAGALAIALTAAAHAQQTPALAAMEG